MRRKVYRVGLEDIRIGFSHEPLQYNKGTIMVKKNNDNTLRYLSVFPADPEELKELLGVILAYSDSEAMDDFIDKLEEEGFQNQTEDPFRTEWELERILEKAERLKKRLKGAS